ncbi:pilus assembly protein [Dokdonella koreensis]|uniref:Type IV fimbrial biogenesis protein PilY1 n=1 Tax=Dokdonella koreensis DS-123 TaxID=1300342 RepID=A0A167GGZ1_9GAMM|nr:PilC/PilY family type IV pilus protein [Dokdonella koreensis]ANB16546.1 Type IV fimbrial biogenesis protein PilY1 [Dokdonella koreensis DS-123]
MNATSLFDSARVTLQAGALCLLAGLAAPAGAETVDLHPTPPDLTSTVAPNLMLTLDDSGSMGRNFMGDQRPYSGAGWGATDQQNTTSDASYPSGGGPYLCAGIIDPRVTDPDNPRSWAMNGAYYNATAGVVYDPPLLVDGVTKMPNAPFAAAWDNGIVHNRPSSPSASTTRNLGSGSRFCGNSAGYYRLKDTVALTLDADGRIDTASRTRLFTSGNWEWVSIATDGTAAQKQNFANWYSYYHTRHLASKTAVSRAFAPFDENIRVAWQNINSNQINNNTAIYKFRNETANTNVRTRFYNWLFSSPVSGGTPNQAATVRAGEFFRRDTGSRDTNPYWDRDLNRELSCRQNFHINMSDGYWNGGTSTTDTNDRSPATRDLPDGRTYSTSDTESSIFWHENGADARSMADIAFHYWATDLRPDFADDERTRLKVPPYIPDRSTDLFGPALANGEDPRDNKEIYWNPANDPASWPHLVQYMIGFGISGTIPKNENTYERLRRGQLTWPETVAGTDDARKVDDIWHAAVNSRGEFFAASNPNELVSALSAIISNIIARRGSSTALSATMAILTSGTQGFSAGYDTTDWSGVLTKSNLDPTTGEAMAPLWDAGCVLTGGNCVTTGQSGLPVTDPARRKIFTWNGSGGIPFLWGSLSSAQQTALNKHPNPSVTAPDDLGSRRVDYLRGVRTAETEAPLFRRRGSVLGAIVNSQPVYVSGPTGGWEDSFPPGSPEAEAADPATGAGSYAEFIWNYRDRAPTVYVGANDGMLHAFNAVNGSERFAYVPNTLFGTGKLNQTTDKANVVSVDDMPVVQDVFINNQWRSVLVGSLRLGGRGIYALDVTDPDSFGAGNVLWEFSDHSDGGEALGYTYGSANIARLNNGKWVVLVSSGYYPSSNPDPYGFPDPARLDENADRTSLLILDLETGALIREIQTTGADTTFGLSTPAGYDSNGDQVDDVVVAGDLAGNLWRFDVSSADPSAWSADLMFKTYGGGNPGDAGRQPISVMPVAMRDFATFKPVWIFGTGKYLGKDDRSNEGTPSNEGPQAFYGIRDYGPGAAEYPITADQLVEQELTQDGNNRSITSNSVPASNRGWKIPLDIDTEVSERSVIGITPLYASNRAVLTTLIPKGDDPCDPGRRGSVMVVDAATGGVPGNGFGGMPYLAGAQSDTVGVVVNSTAIPISGYPSLVSRLGASSLVMPGIPEVQIPDAPNYRGAWRELLDLL